MSPARNISIPAKKAPRKPHKKARTGCVQCKYRKVKCGEEGRPCRNCVRRGIDCSYDAGNMVPPAPAPSTQKANSPQEQPTVAEVGHLPSGLSRQEELCLVHHYIRSSQMDTVRHDDDSEVWKDMPFHDGLKYEFVLDAVLALAALHKSYLDCEKSKRYTFACLHYQSRSFRAYQAVLTSMDEHNCHAIFSTSVLINIINIAMSRGGPSLLVTPPLETILTSFKLLRGIQTVLRETWGVVKSAHYKAVFSERLMPDDAAVSNEILLVMGELRRQANEVAKSDNSSNSELYSATIDSLEISYKKFEHCMDVGVIVAWPIFLPEQCADLLRTNDPMMLLIFIHYGVLYLSLNDRWWCEDFGRRIVYGLSEILHVIDAAWLPLTSWARGKAGRVGSLSARNADI